MKYFKPIFLLFIISVMLSSCSVSMEKRRYRPGYHVDVVKSQKNEHISVADVNMEVKLHDNKTEMLSETDQGKTRPDNVPPTIVEILPEMSQVPVQKKTTGKNILGGDSCDVVYMVRGERINAIVIEIGEDYVHYKKCDDPKGRLFTVKTKDIDNITLRNGEYYIPKDRKIVDKEKERKKSQTLFVMSIIAGSIALVCFVFSFFISPFSILSFVFSVLDMFFSFILMMINIRPSRYTPSYRTRLAWLFLAIAFVLLIAALVLVLL